MAKLSNITIVYIKWCSYFMQISAMIDDRMKNDRPTTLTNLIQDSRTTLPPVGRSGEWKGTDVKEKHMVDPSFAAALIALLKGTIHIRHPQYLLSFPSLCPKRC